MKKEWHALAPIREQAARVWYIKVTLCRYSKQGEVRSLVAE